MSRRRRNRNATLTQGFDQIAGFGQESDECIWIKDSCNVTVSSHDTQAAVSLQVGLQLAIALVLSISIGDEQGRAVAQEMFQQFDDQQINKQKIYIENTKDCEIVTTDTDLSVNIQALLQVLATLVAKLDIF
ncbi:MAG TPA: spore coat protein [Ureibacillus sp.]|nr:spore coat protein [Ureibacillus sp.]